MDMNWFDWIIFALAAFGGAAAVFYSARMLKYAGGVWDEFKKVLKR